MYENKKEEYFEIDNRIRNSKRKLNNLLKNINVIENTDIDKLVKDLEEKQEKLNEINNILNNNIIEKIDEHIEYKLRCISKIKTSIINNTLTKELYNSFREELYLIEKTDKELKSSNVLTYFCKTNNALDTEVQTVLEECDKYFKNPKKDYTPVINSFDDNFIEKPKDISIVKDDEINKNSNQWIKTPENATYGRSAYLERNKQYKYIVIKNVCSGSYRTGYVVIDKEKESLFYISMLAFYESKVKNIEDIKENININLPYSSKRIFKDNITVLKSITKIQLDNCNDYSAVSAIIKTNFLEYEKAPENIKRILFDS